jgi:PHP family Zn ribbon phosphoesterase
LKDETEAMPSLKHFRADLHLHTALSPCGDGEMTPVAIVATAARKGLDMIAVCDHNSSGNVAAVQDAGAARADGLTVLPGMELTTAEEVHVVALFPDAEAAARVASRVRALLPQADPGYYSFFGEQPLLAADGSSLGSETAALALAIPLSLSKTVELIHGEAGLALAAHVDRRPFGVFSQLGFFPADAGFDGVELSRRLGPDPAAIDKFAALGLPMIGSSDSHYLEEIGSAWTIVTAAEPTFAELALALRGAGGRSVAPAWRTGDA